VSTAGSAGATGGGSSIGRSPHRGSTGWLSIVQLALAEGLEAEPAFAFAPAFEPEPAAAAGGASPEPPAFEPLAPAVSSDLGGFLQPAETTTRIAMTSVRIMT
jgi:hypothetical protein